jgi:hypothetical protein
MDMTRLICDISMSLDGFVAGPNQTLEEPLGERGERLHEWGFRLRSFREPHGLPGGETGPDDVVAELQVHVVPVLLGGGVRLFDGPDEPVEVEATRVISSPAVTHLRLAIRERR